MIEIGIIIPSQSPMALVLWCVCVERKGWLFSLRWNFYADTQLIEEGFGYNCGR